MSYVRKVSLNDWREIPIWEHVVIFMKIYFIFTKQNYRKQTFHLLLLCFLHFTEQIICAASGVSSWNTTESWSPIYLNVPFKVWGCIKDSWHQQHWIFSCCLQPELEQAGSVLTTISMGKGKEFESKSRCWLMKELQVIKRHIQKKTLFFRKHYYSILQTLFIPASCIFLFWETLKLFDSTHLVKKFWTTQAMRVHVYTLYFWGQNPPKQLENTPPPLPPNQHSVPPRLSHQTKSSF